jgi:N-methylhydantoinase A
MINLIRQISVERGYDPRDFALVAFGGAGPVHAGVLAEELGMPYVIVPPYPGVLSAMGLVLGDIHYDLVQSYVRTWNGSEFTHLKCVGPISSHAACHCIPQ